MAPGRRPAVGATGLRQLARDLRAIDRGLERELGEQLKHAADPIVAAARHGAPRGTRPIPTSRVPRKRLADTIAARRRGLRVAIQARGPHARIVHDGGRRPLHGDRGRAWIAVVARPFIADAIDARAEQVIDALADTVDRALTRHGFK